MSPRYVVGCGVDVNSTKPSSNADTLVALDRLVYNMSHEDPCCDATYAEIGGLQEQRADLRAQISRPDNAALFWGQL